MPSSSRRAAARVTVERAVRRPISRVTVEDTGVGIGAGRSAAPGRSLLPGRSSYDRRHDGAGLGLSIVKGLVRLHGGEVDIRSRLGEGTRVTCVCRSRATGRAPTEPVKLVAERATRKFAVWQMIG